jgi:hypothetical protein
MFSDLFQYSQWRSCLSVLPKSRVVLFFFVGKKLSEKDFHEEMFPVYGGKCLSRKAVLNWVANVSLMTKRLKRRCGSGWNNSQKTSVLRVSSRNKCFFPVSTITCFTFYILLWRIYWLSLVILPMTFVCAVSLLLLCYICDDILTDYAVFYNAVRRKETTLSKDPSTYVQAWRKWVWGQQRTRS